MVEGLKNDQTVKKHLDKMELLWGSVNRGRSCLSSRWSTIGSGWRYWWKYIYGGREVVAIMEKETHLMLDYNDRMGLDISRSKIKYIVHAKLQKILLWLMISEKGICGRASNGGSTPIIPRSKRRGNWSPRPRIHLFRRIRDLGSDRSTVLHHQKFQQKLKRSDWFLS